MVRRSCLIASGLLCLVAALVWYRSIHTADELTLLTRADAQYTLATHPHGLDFTVTTNVHSHPPTWDPVSPDAGFAEAGWTHATHSWGAPIARVEAASLPHAGYGNVIIDLEDLGGGYRWDPPEKSILGLGYQTSSESWTTLTGTPVTRWATVVVVPLWLVMALLLFPWVGQVTRFTIRRRRMRANRCVSCGYDLRATPGNCPECGAPAAALARRRSPTPL